MIEEFDAAMARLGALPRLAVAVSGGADSMALAVLAEAWARRRGGDVLALIVDHGLRPAAGAEAAMVAARLAALGIASRVLALRGLPGGAGLQAAARIARHAALAAAAAADGRLHLLLGHQAGDQAETVAMRAARGDHGLEGIAGWSAREHVVLLRPLLGVAPGALRAFLAARKVAWVDDPSNDDERFERVRVRRTAPAALPADAAARRAGELAIAAFLARHAQFRPEGFVLLDAGMAPAPALASLLRVVAGADYAPARAAVARLAETLRPATLGGVRVMPAGRLGAGWLLAREPAGCAGPVAARAGQRWDGRFALLAAPEPPAMLGALGADAAAYRKFNGLPAIVLRTMPCLRGQDGRIAFPAPVRFAPAMPAAGHPFAP